jgi:hypothetical protein
MLLNVKIKATPIKGRDLKPGDLFSTANQDYWDNYHLNYTVGERVYIRTDAPAGYFEDQNAKVYKIEIIKEE